MWQAIKIDFPLVEWGYFDFLSIFVAKKQINKKTHTKFETKQAYLNYVYILLFMEITFFL